APAGGESQYDRRPARVLAEHRPVSAKILSVDAVLLLKALFLGVVEGLTEFLPISSTGHLVVAGELVGPTGERWDVFKIVIQTGAMLAVVWEYRARFFRIDVALYRNLIVAFIPAAVLGLLFSKYIKGYLFHAVPVAIAFIVGGLVILFVEKRSFTP